MSFNDIEEQIRQNRRDSERWMELSEVMKDRACPPNRLAELTGIDASNISHYLQGSRKPNVDNLQKLADSLMCSTDELLGLQPIKKIDEYYDVERDLEFILNTHEQDISDEIERIRQYINRVKKFGQ